MNYTKEELLNISGGAFNWTIAGVITGLVVFVIGIVDGYIRPLDCNYSK